jgi:hypothetical protein
MPIARSLGRRRTPDVAHRSRNRGQSLVEFALVLPVLLLIVAGAIDLGRAYLTTINIQNAAKEGAFQGARDPACDTNAVSGCADPQTVEARVELELDGIPADAIEVRCYPPDADLSDPAPLPTAKPSLVNCVDGDLYRVTVDATFHLVTPIIGAIVGDSLALSASATSVVVTSFVAAAPIEPDPGGTPLPTLAPGDCMVPDFTNGTKIRDAQSVWEGVAGFQTSATAIGPSGQSITWQSRPAGFVGPCTTTSIVVSNEPQATPTPSPSPTPNPTASPTPTPSPTPAMCIVPNMTAQGGLRVTEAQGAWSGAGFRSENFSAQRPPNDDYKVKTQSIQAGELEPCLTTSITVTDR